MSHDDQIPHDRVSQLQALGLDPDRLDCLLGSGSGWVRPARHDDAAALSAIYNETALTGRNSPADRPYTAAGMEHLINVHRECDWPVWVCLSHRQIVGFVLLRPFSWNASHCFETAEHAVYIGAAWRGIGLGDALFALAPVLAERRGCRNIVSWILANNHASLALFRKSYAEWAYFPSLARSAGTLCDVHVLGAELEQWFATARGREARRHQIEADARMNIVACHTAPSPESIQGVSS